MYQKCCISLFGFVVVYTDRKARQTVKVIIMDHVCSWSQYLGCWPNGTASVSCCFSCFLFLNFNKDCSCLLFLTGLPSKKTVRWLQEFVNIPDETQLLYPFLRQLWLLQFTFLITEYFNYFLKDGQWFFPAEAEATAFEH